MIAEKQSQSFSTENGNLARLAYVSSCESDKASREPPPRVALLTPYTGNNLGDAAIQDALIANLRDRLPGIQFSGICLDCDNFVERHGTDAFPLCAVNRPFHGMSQGRNTDQTGETGRTEKGKNPRAVPLKRAVTRVPILGRVLKTTYTGAKSVWRECRHFLEGYRFLRKQDLVIVSGGGQLDEEWGGAWGHPFALFKWGVLARSARIPYVMASVGACKVSSATSRLFLSAALRLARYRSYRDKNSGRVAARLLQGATRDSIVPDLALSLPLSELPPPASIRPIAQGRTVVAISPIVYAKPQSWPHQDGALYDRYLQQMAQLVAHLLQREYFLVIVWSSLADKSVIPELLERLDEESKQRLKRQLHIPMITTWKDLVAVLQDVDFLIASRLHSAILAFLVRRPTIAVSFDPKVDWVMEEFHQNEYLLQIGDFTAREAIDALSRIELRRNSVLEQITSYRHRIIPDFALQYDALAELAKANHQGHN
jgi:polysaccharide pyruvyl transferase WcaK-like protein